MRAARAPGAPDRDARFRAWFRVVGRALRCVRGASFRVVVTLRVGKRRCVRGLRGRRAAAAACDRCNASREDCECQLNLCQ